MRLFLKKIASSTLSTSFASKLRKRRFELFNTIMLKSKPVTILDIGGTERYWEIQNFVNTQNRIIILNVNKVETHYSNIDSIIGDARDLSKLVMDSVEIIFSNSVIEHLGNYEEQEKMAREVRQFGKKYYIQTPNYYFPFEPHFLVPFFHWFPTSIRVFLIRNISLGWYEKIKSKSEALML